MFYVYVIKNKYSGKVYVGSTNNFNVRIRNHLNKLRAGIHTNRRMQKDYYRYGSSVNTFTYYMASVANSREEAERREQIFMDGFSDKYNILPNAGTQKGRTFTKSTLDKMSETAKKRDNSNLSTSGAKINESIAYEMHCNYGQGLSRRDISSKFGITYHHVNSILRGRTWKRAYEKYYGTELY